MLDSRQFDLWAVGYDRSVGLSDDNGEYPFAGYREVLNLIYSSVLQRGAGRVLDIGFGTGKLTKKLYDAGCEICGQDFSARMTELAQEKMPEAKLITADFSEGLAPELKAYRFDAVIATYSLHHLDDARKAAFIGELPPLLNEGGRILIGDVAFGTRRELELCRERAGESWDDEEFYFVYEELQADFPKLEFTRISHCAGVFSLSRD
ncbi:MAG: class I SAM-dependent methyltransferase [Clostridia bacterium]|nr:class I SAM-dependent methyltransferase [Clostridia bacterium]